MNVCDPFNLTLNRSCINFSQIGNDRIDCPYSEDEYLKQAKKALPLPQCFSKNEPNTGNYIENNILKSKIAYDRIPSSSLDRCNRGVVVQLHDKSLVCFRPPQYHTTIDVNYIMIELLFSFISTRRNPAVVIPYNKINH